MPASWRRRARWGRPGPAAEGQAAADLGREPPHSENRSLPARQAPVNARRRSRERSTKTAPANRRPCQVCRRRSWRPGAARSASSRPWPGRRGAGGQRTLGNRSRRCRANRAVRLLQLPGQRGHQRPTPQVSGLGRWPPVESESASPGLGHRGLLAHEPYRLNKDNCRSDAEVRDRAAPAYPPRSATRSWGAEGVFSWARLQGPGRRRQWPTGPACAAGREHASVPLRRVRAGEVRVRTFSTNSRPALRAAACGGRPRAGNDTTVTGEPAHPPHRGGARPVTTMLTRPGLGQL